MASDIGAQLLQHTLNDNTDPSNTIDQSPFHHVLAQSVLGIAQTTTQFGLMEISGGATDGQTPFADLLLAVFNSILEVFILCAAGYILARRGVLDKKTQKQINKLNVSLFTPALLFSKVAFFLTPAKLKELWVIPIWFVIVTTTSMIVGRVLGWGFGLRRSQKSFVTAASMFMNSNALPIALMQSLVVSVPDLAWGSDDNKNTMLGRALTYLTMYSTLGMVLRYSYGVSLLSRADTVLSTPAHESHAGTPEEQAPLLQATGILVDLGDDQDEQLRTHPSNSTLVAPTSHKKFRKAKRRINATSSSSSAYPSASNTPGLVGSPIAMHSALPDLDGEIPAVEQLVVSGRPMAKRQNTTFYNSFPNSPNDSRTELPTWDDEESTDTDSESSSGSDCEGCDAGVARREGEGLRSLRERDIEHGGVSPVHHPHCPHHNHTKHHSSPTFHAVHHTLLRLHLVLTRSVTAVLNFMTVPLWAAVLSLFVASVDGVKHTLESHLMPLNEAIDTAGKCAVPITLVVLGAYFYEGAEDSGNGSGKHGSSSSSSNGNGVANGKAKAGEDAKMTFLQRVKKRFTSSSSDPSGSKKKKKKEMKAKPGENKTVWLAVAARMVITPLLLVPLMMFSTWTDWHDVFEDPVFVVVNTILLCSPPALTLAQITASVSGDAFERLISRTIFWSYCIVTPWVMIGSVLLGLWLAKL